MQYCKPVYFDDFSCVAGACPDTCCAGWQIVIDEDSLEKYGEVEGSFGNRLRNSIDWMEGCFYQYDRRCAFLNEADLCDIYSELGPEALCDTCRLYPRHVEEYEGVREWSISLSCPIAARMLLTWQGEVPLLEYEDEEEEDLDDFEDFDIMLYTQLVEARKLCLERLWEADFAGESYMTMVLSLCEEMQRCVEEGEYFRIEEVIADFRGRSWNEMEEAESFSQKQELFKLIRGLERLRPEWDEVLSQIEELLYSGGEEAYGEHRATFEEYLEADRVRAAEYENVTKQLLFFFLYTYFCGAVYDDWIYSKGALCVESVRFIRELFLARWIAAGKKLTMEDYVELSYRYAREIEHSDENLNELEENFIKKSN